MILADPHWAQVQVYEAPIPLWPEQLQPGWKSRFNTKYKTPANQDALSWNQTMKAHAWRPTALPAGQFKTLRFTNMIQLYQRRHYADGLRPAGDAVVCARRSAAGWPGRAAAVTFGRFGRRYTLMTRAATDGSCSNGLSGFPLA